MATSFQHPRVKIDEVVNALAFIGDLSMGQPTDHSLRTAWIAARLALAGGHGEDHAAALHHVAMLRWSGCTGNAPEVAELLGDDVQGREAMLAARANGGMPEALAQTLPPALMSMMEIHCDVSGAIAGMLGLGGPVERALRNIFQRYDDEAPSGHGADVQMVFEVAVASDLEIFSRTYGIEHALKVLGAMAGKRYPAAIALLAQRHAADWLERLNRGASSDPRVPPPDVNAAPADGVPLELIADVIDLKLPWMTGLSRRVAQTAATCAASLGLGEAAQQRLYKSGLIHGIGRAAVPNSMWSPEATLSSGDWERMRLVPYWTARSGRQIEALRAEAELASFCFERLDGSGYFRGVSGDALSIEARILAAAVRLQWLGIAAGGNLVPAPAQIHRQLQDDVQAGWLDGRVVGAMLAESGAAPGAKPTSPSLSLSLSERQRDVLRHISHGLSNKETAQRLDISPSTVATHVEIIFRKLDCTTRAAATLKAATLGWL